jgi:hypothetical protein
VCLGDLHDGLELAALLVMLSTVFLGLPRGRPAEAISTLENGRDQGSNDYGETIRTMWRKNER